MTERRQTPTVGGEGQILRGPGRAIYSRRDAERCLLLISLMLALLVHSAATRAAEVDSIRLWPAPDHTRLVLDLSGPVEHRIFQLENPHRLVLDLGDTRSRASASALDFSNTPIASIRWAARNERDLRIVLDLSNAVTPRSFVLGRNEQYGDRLVIDLYDQQTVTSKTVEDVIADVGKARDVIIAIDAGHGGDDPGAIGPGKIHEKKVVLQISQELKRLVDAAPGYRGVLVRTGDYYIPLQKRPDIARQQRADLFVSVHADAFKAASAHGASVYALSRRGATSETARYLAQRENRADLIGGVGSVSLTDKDAMLAGVLLDLSMTATLDSSLDVGARVLKSMGKIARLHKKHVEQAGFVVLKSPDVPSILVETGFISNPGEAQRLSQTGYQRQMAQAIFQGVKEYFDQSPPEGTALARNRRGSGTVYVVSHGDTLSGIAQRHRISVSTLQRHNQLESTHIRVGQRIKIPISS